MQTAGNSVSDLFNFKASLQSLQRAPSLLNVETKEAKKQDRFRAEVEKVFNRKKLCCQVLGHYSVWKLLWSDNDLLFLIKCKQQSTPSPPTRLPVGMAHASIHWPLTLHSCNNPWLSLTVKPEGSTVNKGWQSAHPPPTRTSSTQVGIVRLCLQAVVQRQAKLWQIIALGQTFLHSVQCCLKPSGWNLWIPYITDRVCYCR